MLYWIEFKKYRKKQDNSDLVAMSKYLQRSTSIKIQSDIVKGTSYFLGLPLLAYRLLFDLCDVVVDVVVICVLTFLRPLEEPAVTATWPSCWNTLATLSLDAKSNCGAATASATDLRSTPTFTTARGSVTQLDCGILVWTGRVDTARASLLWRWCSRSIFVQKRDGNNDLIIIA